MANQPIIATQEKIAVSRESVNRTSKFWRPELDVLRFCAFFLVFITHAAGGIRVGALGVPVFFLLSAYLITELLLREWSETHDVNIRKFYVRRVLRIMPLYFFILGFGYLLGHIVKKDPISLRMLLPYLLPFGNWSVVMHGYLPLGLGVLWSIGVEEQFYLTWPTIVRIGRRKAALIAACVLFVIGQVLVIWLSSRHYQTNPIIWANTLVQTQYFAIGAAISVLLNCRIPRFPVFLRVLFLAAGLGSFWCADLVFNTTGHIPSSIGVTYPGYLITGLGATLLFMAVIGLAVPQWMKPFVYLGKISYGLYLFHPLVLETLRVGLGGRVNMLTRAAIALPLTILIASLSYRYFETPFLRLKHRFETVSTRPV
ncbi:MAG TPA: acyltransferase [Terracidiphilus sp.]|jgi:peptidoglycan/LPS O-acetylase OafA/YrhL